jgi:hypothetical protein
MANTYLTRTFGTATNRKKFTLSMWVKLSGRGSGNNNSLLVSGASGQNEGTIKISSDAILWNEYNVGSATSEGILVSNQLLRDYSAWYHLVFAWDSTNATADDRMKIYLNGEQVTSFSSRTNPSLNYDAQINNNIVHEIGRQTWNSSGLFDGSMSHIHFIDGTAYDATAFGEYDANGVWKIIVEPSVTYGTNGFFILKNGNSVTDQSGNGNNFTVGGGTLTNTEDCPSNVFATGNPLDTKVSFAPVFSNGNNTMSGAGSGTGDRSCRGTLGFASGKFYWEIKYTSNSTGNSAWTGILNPEEPLVDGNTQSTQTTNNVLFNLNGGELRKNGSLIATYSGAVNDIFGFAYDLDAGTLKIHKNGTYFNSGNAVVTSISADTYLPYFAPNSGSSYVIMNPNFGNGYFGTTAVASAGTNASGIGIFEYDVPTGYTALSTKGLNL